MSNDLGAVRDESSLPEVVRDLLEFIRKGGIVARRDAARIWRASPAAPMSADDAVAMLAAAGIITTSQGDELTRQFVGAQRTRLEEMVHVARERGFASPEMVWAIPQLISDFDSKALRVDPRTFLVFEGMLTSEQADKLGAGPPVGSKARDATIATSSLQKEHASNKQLDQEIEALRKPSDSGYRLVAVGTVLFIAGLGIGYTVGSPKPTRFPPPPIRLIESRGTVEWPDWSMASLTQPTWLVGTWRCRDESEHRDFIYRLAPDGFLHGTLSGMGRWGVPWTHPNLIYWGRPGDLDVVFRGSFRQMTLLDGRIELRSIGRNGPDLATLQTCNHVSGDPDFEIE